jgi:hypothetical protein
LADVKIGVNADGSNVSKAIDDITDSVNTLAKAVADAGKVKFKPVDVQAASRDLQTLNQQFEIASRRSKSLRDALKATGQTGRAIQDVDFRKLSVDPAVSQRMRDKAFGYSARGTAWDVGNFAPLPATPPQPRKQLRPREEAGSILKRAGKSFASGVGGGFGQIANGAINGAANGAANGASEADSGGLLGGLGGLLKGGLVGAGLFGLFKAGQSVADGYGMAKDRDLSLDTLKRQMGDLGISFTGLKAMSDLASQGLGINSKEFVQFAEQYNKISHNPDKSADGLMGDVRTSVAFGRGYGLDPSAGVNFFAGMKQLDPKQNNRELALQIGEAVNRSGGRAMADDVMRLVQSFAATTARLSLSAPNTDAYATAFGSMLHGGSPGMTADNAAAILGQANSAISGMGNAGEAGQNFIMGSLNAQGTLNPVAARAQAASGLFGTRGATFGADTELSKYLRGHGVDPLSDGTVTAANRDVTNFQAIRANLERQYQDPYVRLDGAQNLFGLSSPEQAAAMLNLDPEQYGGLGKMLSRAGVKLNDVNAGGIATLSSIGAAGSHADLDAVYTDIGKRTGNGSLTADERKTLDAAQKGGTEDFRDALVKIMAGKDQQETEGSKLRAGIKDLETVQTAIGDKMIGPLNVMRDALLKLAGVDGKSATAGSLRKAAYQAERDEANAGFDEQAGGIKNDALTKLNDLEEQRAKLYNPVTGALYLRGQSRETVTKQIAAIDAQMKTIKDRRDQDLAGIQNQRGTALADVDVREKNERMALNPPAAVQPTATEDTAPSATDSRAIGERNNNPFDMRPWKANQARSGGFLKFDSMQAGVTGGFKNLLYAQDHYGRNTISKLIGAYAPKRDHNDTGAYIASVSKMTGLGADQKIDLHDAKVLRAVGIAILKNENTSNSVTSDQIDRGVEEALGDKPTKIANGGSGAARDGGVQDTVNLNITLSSTSRNQQGATVQHNLQTQVSVPRGSGVQNVALGQVSQ